MFLEFPRIEEKGQNSPKTPSLTTCLGITSCYVGPALGLVVDCSFVASVEKHEKHHLNLSSALTVDVHALSYYS